MIHAGRGAMSEFYTVLVTDHSVSAKGMTDDCEVATFALPLLLMDDIVHQFKLPETSCQPMLLVVGWRGYVRNHLNSYVFGTGHM